MIQAAAFEKFTFNLHLREYLCFTPLTDYCNNPLMEAVSGNEKKIPQNSLNKSKNIKDNARVHIKSSSS